MQDNTDKRFKENEEKENRRVQAELKDKIGQSYRYYHDIKKINDIEMETLEGLIKTYEDYLNFLFTFFSNTNFRMR